MYCLCVLCCNLIIYWNVIEYMYNYVIFFVKDYVYLICIGLFIINDVYW